MLYHTRLCTVCSIRYTILHTILYTIVYYTILCYATLDYTILYNTIRYYIILYYILYSTLLYYTILYHTLLCHTILCHTILYYTHKTDHQASKPIFSRMKACAASRSWRSRWMSRSCQIGGCIYTSLCIYIWALCMYMFGNDFVVFRASSL